MDYSDSLKILQHVSRDYETLFSNINLEKNFYWFMFSRDMYTCFSQNLTCLLLMLRMSRVCGQATVSQQNEIHFPWFAMARLCGETPL